MRLFFLCSGILLNVIAFIQLRRSLGRRDAPIAMRLFSREVLRALVFIAAGVFGLLVGVGIVALPMPPHGAD